MSERDSSCASPEKRPHHISKNYERILIARVHSGEWWITAEGHIWAKRTRTFTQPKRIDRQSTIGYCRLSVAIDGKKIDCWAHRLVWQFHRGDIPLGMTVNHKNRVRSDNRIDNLELCSIADNVRHAYFGPDPARHNTMKLTPDDVRAIRASSASHAELSRQFHVVPKTIREIRSRKLWSHVQ